MYSNQVSKQSENMSEHSAAQAVAIQSIRSSGGSTLEREDQGLVEKIPSEELRKLDLVLGTLLVGYVSASLP
jgi:hypothetical protein